MMVFWLAAGLLLGLLLYCIVLFNRLVARRNHAREAWSGIDVQLKRRHDLLPKLVDVVKAYGRFEQATLQGVTEARTPGAIAARRAAEKGLTPGIGQHVALEEAYPDIPKRVSLDDLLDVEAPDMGSARSNMSPLQAFDVALSSEQKSFSFYDQALAHVANPEIHALFTELRDEETEHVRMVREAIANLPPAADIEPEMDDDELPAL